MMRDGARNKGAWKVTNSANAKRRTSTVRTHISSETREDQCACHDVSELRRRNMRAIRAKNTKPELLVRRLLHSMGYRYSLHCAQLPGRPDIVFHSRRKVIEVRGCFWHRHPDPNCRNTALPTTRRDYWAAKLAANVQRDARNAAALTKLRWDVLVVWECELTSVNTLAKRLAEFLGPTRHLLKSHEAK